VPQAPLPRSRTKRRNCSSFALDILRHNIFSISLLRGFVNKTTNDDAQNHEWEEELGAADDDTRSIQTREPESVEEEDDDQIEKQE